MTCPACGYDQAMMIMEIAFERIWRDYGEVLDANISAEVRSFHTPAEYTVLRQCHRCGVQFFSPARAGNSEFYDELSGLASVPYHTERWEFTKVADELTKSQTVVDVGAGPGWFLELARSRGCEVLAVEHNPRAIHALRERRIQVYESLDELSRQDLAVDVVTAFHMVEHVTEVNTLYRQATTLLQKGGSFFVSVPNIARSFREDFEPLDMPPHHISRWSEEALANQARIHGLEIVAITPEPPDASAIRSAAREQVFSQVHPPLSEKLAWFMARVAGRLMSREPVVRHLLRDDRYLAWGYLGHSLLAHYRKPWGG